MLAAAAADGCDPATSPQTLATQLAEARKQTADLYKQVKALEQDVSARDEHIARLQGLGDKRMDLLFIVADIKLGRTSGVNLDKTPGDDGVRVYLKPIDRNGHTLKAAGAVTIQLFDLSEGAAKNLLERHDFPVEQAAEHWSSFLASHYRFDCPWTAGPPKAKELTVRVTFTDYLTGKTFTAQKVITIDLPTPATQPAK